MTDNTPLKKIQQKIILDSNHTGQRLDSIITSFLPEYSRSQIQKWITDGQITINNQIKKNKYIVIGHETVDINVEIIPANEWVAEDIHLNIVYEDDDIVVINKHAGIVVHPGAGNTTGTISNALLNHHIAFKELPRAGIVHRLDKDTTGLMVAAKSTIAYNSLIEQLSNRSVSRKYYALVDGIIDTSDTINKPIGRSTKNRTKMAIVNNGKEAITHFTPIEIFDNHTLIECKLETGRTHQIRVHMKSIGHPLVGDQTYNKNKNNNKTEHFHRQALHAHSLSFTHPTTNNHINFTSPLPNDMFNLIQNLK